MAVKGDCALCLVSVGELRLLFEPAGVQTIEGRYDPTRAVAIPEIDLRRGLEVEALEPDHAESLVVLGPEGRIRLIVCRIEQILRSDLRAVWALPVVLRSFGRRLGLRGVVNLEEGIAYLAAPADLGTALSVGEAA